MNKREKKSTKFCAIESLISAAAVTAKNKNVSNEINILQTLKYKFCDDPALDVISFKSH